MKFLLERSLTPIYQRIINAFGAALSRLGHTASLIDWELQDDYLKRIAAFEPDFILIANPGSTLSLFTITTNQFVYELVPEHVRLVFIHHDNMFSNLKDSRQILQKIESFLRVKHRSYHFCLESDNCFDLKSIGIDRAYPIEHASEFFRVNEIGHDVKYPISFVGHVVPNLETDLNSLPYSHWARKSFWNRIVDFSYSSLADAIRFSKHITRESAGDLQLLGLKYSYLSLLHMYSQHFRGEVVQRLDCPKVQIIGGDPAYLSGSELNRKINKENIEYHPPLNNYSNTREVYKSSLINLNITSLQFNSAVINRVIDVAAVGGFILTDTRTDLFRLTSVAKEISYSSIEELNFKIAYYSHPDHRDERSQICQTLHEELKQTCSYDAVVTYILDKINNSSTQVQEKLSIDLGCGISKPEGYIGVDVKHGSKVDVVADLNLRFPFRESSAEIIRAHDVIEHLVDRIHTMNEIWRICKPGGVVDVRVPSTDGRGAFQDPTHISYWNINSFRYYCVEFPAYLQLCHSYGFKGQFSILSLDEEHSEDEVIHVLAKLKAIK